MPEVLRPLPGSGPLSGPLVHLDVTGSTNDRARELAEAGAPDGTVVVAEEQSAGRGRQGRAWIAPRGGALTLSVVSRSVARLELLPLAAGLAVCDACEAVAPVRCQIKWPNDVWITGRKVAGILIEGRPQDRWCVIGIGLNVETSEHDLGSGLHGSATSLRIAADANIGRERALWALFESLAGWRSRLERTPASVLDAFRKRDALNGRRVSWANGTGEALGVDERGNLLVSTPADERLALAAGEVHLEALDSG